MRATATPSPNRNGKRRLFESCAIAAGMMALAYGGPALAQVAGSGTVTNLPAGTTNGTGVNPSTVTVNGSQNIVTWTPSNAPVDGVIDFLPTGNTLNFVGNTPGYIVLNRFTSASGASITDQIALNGTVNSTVGATTGPRGGNIWFQNAGGVLIGSSGVINVGSLVLTSNDIDTTGGLLGPGNTIRFRGAPGSTASVSVLGAINANNVGNPGSSYVALVAPRVVQAGAVRVDGSAAYVAAEQADIRINNGLFDINVTVGAEGGDVITHTGSTSGPAHQQGDVDQNRIYMVAIPKNDAVTMLVSGQIGYDDALSAQVDPDGAVRLSAGYNITGGELDSAPVNATAANITINDTLFRSDTVARSSGALVGQPVQVLPPPVLPFAPPPQQGRIVVQGNGTFIGDASATFNVNAGRAVGATGNFTVQSGGANGASGSAAVNVNGGQFGAGGNLVVSANGQADAVTGDATGGTATLNVNSGGLATVTGNITVSANAIAGFDATGNGGDGTGGSATIQVSGTGSVLLGSAIVASTVGVGGGLSSSGPVIVADNGGSGFGGTSLIIAENGGSLSASTAIGAVAAGAGQIGTVQSGDGQGGLAWITVTDPGTSLQSPQTLLNAAGIGGTSISDPTLGTFDTLAGGNGRGGIARIIMIADATATVDFGATGIDASGSGGSAGGDNAMGGDGRGGSAIITANGGGTFQFDELTATAAGNSGNAASLSGQTASSGDAQGGSIELGTAGGSTIAVNTNALLDVTGITASGENVGSGTGGNVTVSTIQASNINIGSALIVDAAGGSFGSAVFAQSAGSGTGGDVDLTSVGGGAIRANGYVVNAGAGVVNVSGASGAAQGGTIDVSASTGGQILTTGSSGSSNVFDTSAFTGVSAAGSSATGGTIQFIANGGAINMATGSTLAAGGVSGGAINPGPNNPVGRGGTILVQLVAEPTGTSAITLGDFNAAANGATAVDIEGSPSIPDETAGSGQGGDIRIDVQGGTLTTASINASANGFGGSTAGGAGGALGSGGFASFTQTGGTTNVGDMTISADGFGGTAPGQSGAGQGGTAIIDLSGGTITAADIVATANGLGGDGSTGNDNDPANITPGGLGGAGQGGEATINIGGTAVVDASVILANAAGTGGTGGEFFNASSFGGSPGTPGNGGGGTGGSATVNVTGGTTTASGMIADASGFGGAGGNSFFSSSSGGATGIGVGGQGGTGQGGTATIALESAVAGVGSTSSIAQGTGGAGGNHNVGGAGGEGFGGLAQAIVTNFDAGQLAVTLDSSGTGGNGGDGRDGAGGNGGGGGGGVSRLAAEGDATLTAVETNFITNGTGGNGGNGQLGFGSFTLAAPSGGNGGDGRGGTLEVAANGGGTVTLGLVVGDTIALGSTGTGGNGGNGSGSVFDPNGVAGDGGVGGGGTGGTVRLVTNGGTISSNGESVAIDVGGVSGTGGLGGTGNGGGTTGANGGSFGTAGGRVAIEALNSLTGPGAITLGNTEINANGETAGRIELRAEGNISFAGLDAEAAGFALPTNNDTDVAPAGIFFAMNGGTISSQGDASLTTGSSFGAYAQSDGTFDVNGTLTINAVDQIDIRHDFREGAAPTIRAGDELTATAGGISGGPGSLLASGGTLSLTSTLGAVGVGGLDAVDIVIDAAGAASVEHAEADNDFTATGTSFRTGLNSIITGGDISVTSPGTIDLGNSTAGGSVFAEGQSIAFTAIDAGTVVTLRAQGFGPIDGVNGDSIVAGGNIALTGQGITVDDIQTTGSLSASASNGPATLTAVTADGNISVSANGNVFGAFNSGGNINLRSTADITATANATGGYIDSSTGFVSEGTAFADADGNANVTGSAATMFGVRTGGSATLDTVTAGEDVFVLAGTTANLANVTAGDDLYVRADGGVTIQASQTTGTGPDGRSIVYQACCSNPTPFLQVQTSTADLSNVTLLAPTSTINATDVTAFDNFTATAGGAVTAGGLIRSGLATTISGSDLTLAAITAGTDITLTASSDGIGATGAIAAGHDVTITAAGAVDVSEFDAGDDIRVNAGGALTIGGAYSYGTGADNEGDGSNIVLSAGDTDVTHAESDNDFIADVGSFTTGLDSIITGGDIIVTSAGAVDMGNSTAGGFVSVTGQSIAFTMIDAGGSVSLSANDDLPGATGISGGSIDSGGDVDLNAPRIAITGTVSGTGTFSANSYAGPIAINLADFDDSIFVSSAGNITGTYNSGSDIRLNSGAGINATANAIGSQSSSSGPPIAASVFADAAENVVLTNSSASGMFGVNAGGSATLTGVTAGEDIFVRSANTTTLTNLSAGDDLTVLADGNIIASGLATTGAGPDGQTLVYEGSPAVGGEFLVTGSAPDGSNISLTAVGSSIAVNSANASGNLTATAGGSVTSTGLLQSGQATTLTGSGLALAAITAGTDIAITASNDDFAATGTLTAGNDIDISAVGAVNVAGLDAGDDIRIGIGNDLTIGNAYSRGTGTDDEGDGSNIVLAAAITRVDHAEADNDFTASVGRFTTGLNSIITGGDIVITSGSGVDLGNSSAGGLVSVGGETIAFNSIVAGSTVSLSASGTFGATPEISGGSIDAGGDIILSANRIAVTGPVTGDAGLFAFGGSSVAIDQTDIAGDISVTAGGDLTGNYVAGGNITLNSDGNITATAVANGGYVGPNGISEGYVFADADGNVTLTNSSAATMLGVRAGQAASVSNATAGEDVFVTAGTNATLANITAGDDLTATAGGGITANGLTTTGTGPDGRSVIYGPLSAGIDALQITTSAADQSNIALTASTGNIGGGAMDAFDNLTLVAAGAITASGTLQSGQATSINGRNVIFNAIDAGTTVDVSASGTTAGAEGIRGVDISAGGDINLSGNSIALTGTVDGGASLFANATGGTAAINQADLAGNIAVSAAGNLSGSYAADGNVSLTSDANVNASAIARGTTADGNLFIDAGGNVVLANSTAARMFGVNAGGSAAITGGTAGEDLLVRAGTTASLTNVTAGDDVDIRAGGNVTANNVSATGTGADTRLLSYMPGSGFTIMQGEGTSSVDGSDVRIASTNGSIDATTLSAGDDISLVATGGNATLSGATTLGLGVTGGSSNISVQAADATLAGLNSADDVLVTTSGTTSVDGAIVADRDIAITAGAVNLATLATPGGNVVDTLAAGRNITVAAADDISGGRINAIGDITLTSGGAIEVAGIFGNNVAVDGATGITADQLFAVGTTTLNSDNGAIALNTLVSSGNVDATADSIVINGGSMIFSNIVTDVGDAIVRGGDLFIINGNIAGRAEFSSSGERLGVTTLTAQSAALEASGGFMTLDNVDVSGALSATARTSLGITGVVTGQSISLASANIDIASTGRVGTAGATGEVSIANNNPDNQTFVGGTGTPNGYHIDANELTRVFGSDVEIFAPEVQAASGGSVGSAAPPDVIVDSFTMTGGASGSNLGASGQLTIRTPGKMRVIGNVQLTGLTDANALNLLADDALEVILGQGSVRLISGNAPAGQLNMASDDIIVATADAIADVGAATTTDAIETRLAQNDGVLLDEGALFARGIRAEVVGGFYVQNSGAGTRFAERRGMTFGAGGLDVLTEGPSRIVINGVHLGPNGQVTGLDTIPLLTIAGSVPAPGSFDPRSTFNGCLITGAAACNAPTGNSFPVQDVIEEESEGDKGDGNNLPQPLITMRDLDPLSGEPLLDDPVTGAGNDDLWTPELDSCDPGSASGGTCPAAE
ncbi:hypothetical protein [Sphingopyxis sp.]|uniref:hypothetical protein n=1 Tax=Sphingopyxis sp. TaxID=1908224 RepID=UPI002DF68FA0|nr:hypothetical protein [Sphingopyxis sp.]